MMRRLCLLAPVLLGLGLRCCSVPTTFTDDGIELFGTDAYYHALHTEQVVAEYPRVPGFDPKLHHPDGAQVLYPGGFHFMAATVARVVGAGANPRDVWGVCALFPLLLYLLTSLLILWAAQRHELVFSGGRPWVRACAALTLHALAPPAVYLTAVGNFDHHPMETLFLVATIAMAAGLLRLPSTGRAVACGLVMAAMELFWVQSVLFGLLFAVSALVHRRVEMALAAAVAAAGYLAIYLVVPAAAWMDLNQVSLAQPLIGCLAAAAALVWVARGRTGRIVAAVAAAAMVVLLWQEVAQLARQGMQTVLGTNPFLAMASESRSYGPGDAWSLFANHGLLLLAGPILLLRVLRRRPWPVAAPTFAVVFFVALLLMLLQRRFSSLYVGAAVLLGGEAAAWLWDRVPRRVQGWRGRAALAASLLVLLFPVGALGLRARSNRSSHPVFVPLRRACRLIRGSGLARALDHRGLGVLARWDLGHWVRHYCGLATVTSPMTASRAAREHNAAAMRLFYERDPRKVRRGLRELRVGLVMAVLPNRTFQELADAMGIEARYVLQRGDAWVFQPELFGTFNGVLSFAPPRAYPAWLERIHVSHEGVVIDGRRLPLLVVARVRQ